jgi:cytochrome c oxidase assembly factor CtaG
MTGPRAAGLFDAVTLTRASIQINRSPSPLAFTLHLGAWVVILAVLAAYAGLIRQPEHAVSRRQAWSFRIGVVALAVALTWPLADLAAHQLLLALVVQRLLLMLAVPPLVIGGIPPSLFRVATRPSIIDATIRAASRPITAVFVVTIIAVATLSVPAVDAQASNIAARASLDLLLLIAGAVLWLPVLHRVPGTDGLSPLASAAYLIVQSIVPSFLAVVWIFARHPLYPVYSHHGSVFGVTPLLDQQLSGFLAKLGTIAVLWTVGYMIVFRSGRTGGADDRPLTWADVERQLERVARRERRVGGPPQEGTRSPPNTGPKKDIVGDPPPDSDETSGDHDG